MKKYLYLFLFLSFLFFGSVRAEEANISYRRLDGIYFNLMIDGNFQSNHVTSFYLNDRIAYCIEPGVEINTHVYDVDTDWERFEFSSELRDYIEKVGYYGYEYPGHSTDRYYIAAQELIWKAIRPDMEVAWTTEINKSGQEIDVSFEKNEIENLVSSHSLLPSFALNGYKGYLGDEIVLEDDNGVLEQYDISESEYHNIIKEGNKITIKLNDKKVPSENIVLSRGHYDTAPLLIYSRGDSQKLAALRITGDKETYFTLENEKLPEEVIEVPDTGIKSNLIDVLIGMVLFAF